VTQTPGPTQARHVVVVGAGACGQTAATALRTAGITGVLILDSDDVISSVFDDDTHTWALQTTSGQLVHGAVVVAAQSSVHVPWIPELPGRNDFRGVSFHASQWDPDFGPAGKHIAVIGTDATAGHYIERRTEQAASVTVFAHAPRRIVQEYPFLTTRAKRWLRRRTGLATQGGRPALVGTPIESVTPSGIRTSDGVDHRADVIVYGTGLAISDRTSQATLVGTRGLTIRQAWENGMEPFLGVAVHGFPNYFFRTGPDIDAQTRYVVNCIRLMARTASTRIEVRRSSQQVFNARAYVNSAEPGVGSAFDLSATASEDDRTYDGAATLTIAGARHPVRVRLSGHLDPIDGRYHWQGMVFGSESEPLPDEVLKQARATTLTVDDRSAPARIVEQTPWGTHSIAGIGAPPYALNDP
jgi:cation diffusion facilitator CzcD-associated flavoprotein CzcO